MLSSGLNTYSESAFYHMQHSFPADLCVFDKGLLQCQNDKMVGLNAWPVTGREPLRMSENCWQCGADSSAN